MALEGIVPHAAVVTGAESFQDEFWPLFLAAYNAAFRIMGDRAAAEDVAADAMARAHLHWNRVGRLSYRRPWVIRVAANRALDIVRRKPLPVERPGSASFEDDAAARVTIARALDSLPRRQREVVVLRFVTGMSNEEAAEALGIGVPSVRTHLRRGVARLRAELRDLPEEALNVPVD